MTGHDYDPDDFEDGPETFGPVPHPDDRLWRHPSEIAAMHAASANAPLPDQDHAAADAAADTVEVPAVEALTEQRPRLHRGLVVAAGVVLVGAAALTLGVVSSRGTTTNTQIASEVVRAAPNAATQPPPPVSAGTQLAVEANNQGEERLTVRVHAEVATSLPRIQAATGEGMREGSGFFVTHEGHIATSAGLVAGADYILAWTDDGQRWKAHVIASDHVSDIAVLKIPANDWPSVSLSSGSDLRAGQYALALDHHHHEIAVGQVTATTGPLVEVDQPAALPGSAIVDDTGSVIAMITNDGTNRHATPAWMLEQVAVDLIASGSTTHTWLGVVVENLDDSGDMVRIADVIAGSPGAAAGLRVGDLIDSVNGNAVADVGALHLQIETSEPGDEAVLTVTRNGSRRIIIATLATLPR